MGPAYRLCGKTLFKRSPGPLDGAIPRATDHAKWNCYPKLDLQHTCLPVVDETIEADYLHAQERMEPKVGHRSSDRNPKRIRRR